jgi:hypothetical protein
LFGLVWRRCGAVGVRAQGRCLVRCGGGIILQAQALFANQKSKPNKHTRARTPW